MAEQQWPISGHQNPKLKADRMIWHGDRSLLRSEARELPWTSPSTLTQPITKSLCFCLSLSFPLLAHCSCSHSGLTVSPVYRRVSEMAYWSPVLLSLGSFATDLTLAASLDDIRGSLAASRVTLVWDVHVPSWSALPPVQSSRSVLSPHSFFPGCEHVLAPGFYPCSSLLFLQSFLYPRPSCSLGKFHSSFRPLLKHLSSPNTFVSLRQSQVLSSAPSAPLRPVF